MFFEFNLQWARFAVLDMEERRGKKRNGKEEEKGRIPNNYKESYNILVDNRILYIFLLTL